jgi:hypothetical protein
MSWGGWVSRLKVDRATDADFQEIVRDIVDFWGSDRTLRMHNAMYVHELADSSYVIKEGDRVIAYLLAWSPKPKRSPTFRWSAFVNRTDGRASASACTNFSRNMRGRGDARN